MDYQGWRVRNAQTYLSTVPSILMRSGDFSELNRAIYDPLSQTPFSNNRIPAARIDPVSRNLIDQLYPTPNVAGQLSSTGQTISNFLYNPVLQRQDDQFDVKVNQRLSDSNQFFAESRSHLGGRCIRMAQLQFREQRSRAASYTRVGLPR